MGKDAKGESFCDTCFKREGNHFRCMGCDRGAKLMCGACAAIHYRKKHPALWLEIVMPSLKQQREAKG